MRTRWGWSRLPEAMTGVRCHRRKKMMGRGAEGGCGTEEKLCPISRVPTNFPAKQPSNLENTVPAVTDFYAQARKALSERSPFDSDDAQTSNILTLPCGLANFLAKHSDSRKRHKKSHSGFETKLSREGGVEKARGSNIWAETDEYFRDLTVADIEKLTELSCFGFSASRKFFLIPLPGKACNSGNSGIENVIDDVILNEVGADCGTATKDEIIEEAGQFMEVDSVGPSGLPQGEKVYSSSGRPATWCSGLEWLLGSRSKVYLTSERPSKKRKLLGGDAGLEKLLVTCPVEGSELKCHYCSLSDTGDLLNRLIVCSSCKVAVHQRCYGVQLDVTDSWLCCWCKQKSQLQSTNRPCVLCPKQGGALKPVCKRGTGGENGGSIELAHLFCCQWMPEVYVEDTRAMEPVMNIDGIKETRRKLVCCLCKVKCGACVRCSNGMFVVSLIYNICISVGQCTRRASISWNPLYCNSISLIEHIRLQEFYGVIL